MSDAGLKPDLVSFNSALHACAAGGQAERALALLHHHMPRCGVRPDERSYACAITACAKLGQWGRAMQLLGEMGPSRALAGSGTGRGSGAGAGSVAVAVAGGGDRGSSIRPSPDVICYNAVLHACAEAGRWSTAEELIGEMHGRGLKPDVFSFCSLISAYGKGGAWEKALQVWILDFENLCNHLYVLHLRPRFLKTAASSQQ